MGIINVGFQSRGNPSGKKLPPGQSAVTSWPVLTYGATPHLKPEDWSITIDGAVAKPITLTWDEFNKLPETQLRTDIHCVTRWSKLDMPWEGVTLDELIKLAGGLTADAHFAIAESEGGYTTNIPVKEVINGQALIATMAGGKPLPDEHGGPARFFVPHLYFWKSAKWVRKVTFAPEDQPGFWEVNGYNNHGDPWKEERYDSDE